MHPFKGYILQKGSALISALFIMTLVAIAATAMSTRLQLDIYRTQLTLNADKLYLASQAVTFWAMSSLSEKKIPLNHSDNTGKLLDFPLKLQTIYPNMIVKGHLYDLQSRFNINNLTDKKYYDAFLNLLKNLPFKTSSATRQALLSAISSWLGPYQPSRGNDELLSYYTSLKPPYYPGHQPMRSISEVRLIKGINARFYNALSDSITVLPETVPININTAAKPILASLGNGLKESEINELLEARGEKGITDLKTIGELLQKLNIRNEQVTIESQYFLSMALINFNDLSFINYSIIKRSKDKKNKITLSIVSESLNTL